MEQNQHVWEQAAGHRGAVLRILSEEAQRSLATVIVAAYRCGYADHAAGRAENPPTLPAFSSEIFEIAKKKFEEALNGKSD